MTDAQTIAWLDQEDGWVTHGIREHRWIVRHVGGHECSGPHHDDDVVEALTPFAYTVGLFGLGHPELLVFSMDPEESAALLNRVGGWILEGRDLVAGELLSFDGWHHHLLVEVVPNGGDIVFDANRHYRRPRQASVPVLQLTRDDCMGRFPWDAGYDLPPYSQPRPGEFRADE